MTNSIFMPWLNFRFPSGDVNQSFWSTNVQVNYAGVPEIERDVVENVASFGKQLGIVTEAVLEIAGDAKGEKVKRLREIAREIEAVKQRRKAHVVREAEEAIERLQEIDEPTLKALLRRYA